MKDVYEYCPQFDDDRFLIRFSGKQDGKDLLEVYSDLQALPFFNSDNCDGDNFYYPTLEKMESAIDFWLKSYETRWFVRWSIIDKRVSKAIGTIEMFHRTAEDDFDHVGVLRLDLKSEYEKADIIYEILSLFIPSAYDLFECREIITKVPVYAIERMEAVKRIGFEKSYSFLIGTHDRYAYNGYWMIRKSN